ncbi:protein TIPIN homolog [Hylaeus anthracinus]|uniref:protein TIPIN homolog n=1 Tax=Hylaeus anthracinus TaxID=313031 RepID=UPI0023B9A5D3|nr:protein TIPIN homolog [Hylaeus anthracinus]
MPTLSNASDYEDVDDIVAEYEKQDSDGDQLNANRDEVLGSENEESEEANTARRIDPSTSKKHVIRNPIPKLNTERLKGPKGIQTIEKYFEGFKFHGKGNEKLDLDRIMKRMEHWGHRLFPKLEFDDFLEKVEKLGTKKDLQVFIKKYRLDMISAEDGTIVQDIEDEENDKDQDEPIDEFDLLIAEQIEKQKQVVNQESTAEALFDQVISQTNNKNSQPVQEHSRPPHLSNEVKERIERNRQQAIQRKLARLKAMEDEANKKKLVEAKDTQSEDSSCNVQTPSETQNLENKDFETGSEEANGDHNS